MVTPAIVRQLALLLPGVVEQPHRGQPSFRVRNRTFAVLHPKDKTVVLKLCTEEQSVFDGYDPAVFRPAEGGGGRQGWTEVVLSKVRKEGFREALVSAWLGVAPKTLARQLEWLNY